MYAHAYTSVNLCCVVYNTQMEEMEDFEDDGCDVVEEEENVPLTSEDAEKILVAAMMVNDLPEEDDVTSQIREVATTTARAAQKPSIDHLDDAVVEMEGHGRIFLPEPGNGLIIQYPEIWRDTSYYTVRKIDYGTGTVYLWCPSRGQWALTNFLNYDKHGLVMKMPPEGASELRMAIALGRRKRGRPRKNPVAVVTPPPQEGASRGRGRPKGSKNRPKDIIDAEKKIRREERNAKAEVRSMRHRKRV